ncbi:MAG: hypothetical protein WD737_06305 [Gemmatimonadota bacterium]
MMDMSRSTITVIAVMAVFMLAGCGQELTAGGQRDGEVSTVVTDDPNESQAGPAATRNLISGPGAQLTADPGSAEGTVEVEATTVLVDESGREVPLSSLAPSVSVTIAAADSATLERSEVRVGRYTLARITFTRVKADLTTGLAVAAGVEITGTVRVDLGQPLVVDAPIELTVQEDGRHQLVIDLNASAWLAAADPVLRTVSSTTFRSAVEVRVE